LKPFHSTTNCFVFFPLLVGPRIGEEKEGDMLDKEMKTVLQEDKKRKGLEV